MGLQGKRLWCGLCVDYGGHDTEHHTAGDGGLAAGDRVQIKYEGKEYVANVEEARGKRARVAFSLNRGRTHTIWVDAGDCERLT